MRAVSPDDPIVTTMSKGLVAGKPATRLRAKQKLLLGSFNLPQIQLIAAGFYEPKFGIGVLPVL